MRFVPLIWISIWRKKGRSALLPVQIAIALSLYGILQGLNSAVKKAIARSRADRLYVLSRVNQGEPLPLALLPALQSAAGVRVVAPRSQSEPNRIRTSSSSVSQLIFVRIRASTLRQRLATLRWRLWSELAPEPSWGGASPRRAIGKSAIVYR